MRAILSIFLLFHPCLFQQVFSKEKSELLLVQMLFRHGDRTPLFIYPTDPNSASVWTEGLETLTKIGKQQLYKLGEYFRAVYDDFITTDPNEIYVTSSFDERCLVSAESFLASFFAPKPDHVFMKGVPWQPVAVHYTDKDRDKLLAFFGTCPRALKDFYRLIKDPLLYEGHAELVEHVSRHADYKADNWLNFTRLWDTVKIEKQYAEERNLTIPRWVDKHLPEMDALGTITYYRALNSPTVLRLKTGPLIEDLIKNMKRKIRGESPERKVHIYSGHDSNIAGMLMALDNYNMQYPPYASTLLFELHQMANGVKTVRILYQNSTNVLDKIDDPYPLILEGCGEYCPLTYFIDVTKRWIPEDYEEECKIKKSDVDSRPYSNGVIRENKPLWSTVLKVWRF